MEFYDIVIVGGGPAGATTAISAHNTYPTKKIAVIRKEKIVLIPCGIPYTFASLKSVDEDILPDNLIKNNETQLIIDEVVDRDGKELVLKSGKKIGFDKLVIAAGSIPIMPSMPGINKDGVFLVKKDYKYLSKMRNFAKNIKDIIIVGGGYIGVEMADEALRAGKNVTLVELYDQLLTNAMDKEFGEKICEILENRGAKILLGNKVKTILGNQKVSGIELENGQKIKADMVVISIGSRPNLDLAEKINVKYDKKHGILVNEYLRTSDPDILAVGDCAAKNCFFTGEFSGIMLASTAMAEGRLAGSNLFELKVLRKYNGVLGSFSTKIYNTAFGVCGITESKAKAIGLDYVVGENYSIDRHPSKLIDASRLYLKLIFARYSHTLLGAQMFGGDSVGELVNMFSVMILNKMTDMEIDNLQIGTHPLLTASPIAYPVINATVDSIKKWYQYEEKKEINAIA